MSLVGQSPDSPNAQEGGSSSHGREKACEICGRTFARNEHLTRHRRTHTSERPFGCPHCQNAFPRADVRDKHMKRNHAQELGPNAAGQRELGSKRPKLTLHERSKLACDQCRKKKLKCSDQRPCDPCRTKQLPCTVSSSSRPPGRPRHASGPLIDDSGPGGSNDFAATPREPPSWSTPILESITSAGLSTSLNATYTTLEHAGLTSTLHDLDGLVRPSQDLDRQPDEPNEIILDSAEAGFPLDSSLLFDPAAPVNQGWQDVGFMDTFWELPSLGWESLLNEAGEARFLDSNELQTAPSVIKENVSHTNSAFNMMVEHFKRHSRALSPSRDEPSRSWYSTPPRFEMYSKDMINMLLNLARSHISPTFTIFSQFEATSDTSKELCLAMAAVGALFSTAAGNIAVAKALYNDARRMHLEQTFRIEPRPPRSRLDCAKTFILLEIYGLCSGDKRSFEFWEAFHYGTMQTHRACSDEAPFDPDSSYAMQLSLLSEAVTVLESYRVLILMRPPLFLSPPDAPVSDRRQSVTKDLLSLFTPAENFPASCGNMRNLATITSYAWMSGLRGKELVRTPQLWKPEFVELALERWMSAKIDVLSSPCGPSDLAQLLLYHLAHITLHANLGIFQNFSHQFRQPGTDNDTGMLKSLRTFINGAEFKVAHWHAKALLQVVKESMTAPLSRYQQLNGRADLMEPPHLPYCIYFATLVLWYGESDRRGSTLARDKCIEDGVKLLFKLKVHVSEVLGGALRELLSEDGREGLGNAR